MFTDHWQIKLWDKYSDKPCEHFRVDSGHFEIPENPDPFIKIVLNHFPKEISDELF